VNEHEVAHGLAPTPGYRYADAVGDRLFVAGQVPLDADGLLVGAGDAARQAVACLDNLRTVVCALGFAVNDVRQLTVYVVGERDQLRDAWAAVVGWFDGEVPPATLLGVTCLGYDGQLVEVDVTVCRDAAA
jgi:enamine deaminase RidA (YjgF/YER057c/UK114 family)